MEYKSNEQLLDEMAKNKNKTVDKRSQYTVKTGNRLFGICLLSMYEPSHINC